MIINEVYRILTKSGKFIAFTFDLEDAKEIALKGRSRIVYKKVKGEFIPVFIKEATK